MRTSVTIRQFVKNCGRMWAKKFLIFPMLCLIVRYNAIHAKRILVVAQTPSYSHQITYRSLCLELHKRGHEIVSITTDPIGNSSPENYTEISLNYFYKGFPEMKKVFPYDSLTQSSLNNPFLQEERYMWAAMNFVNEKTFENEEIKKLLFDSNEHFDAVIIEQGSTLSMNAIAYRFNAPLIGIQSQDVYNHIRFTSGSVILPSHASNWQSNMIFDRDLSFWERVVNFCQVWAQIYHIMNERISTEDALVKKYLGKDTPHVVDITKNMSIYLVNRHPAFSLHRLEQPNVIFFHSFHVAKVPPALPDNIKRFLDEADEGFIYVSFGTTVKWKDLPSNTLEAFFEAFCALPYRILWKFSNYDQLPKCENILTAKWLPQQSILAHPNIKLFVYQGGVQSTEETIHYGVPVVGYPVIWDQKYQVLNMEKLGVGVRLSLHETSKETIMAVIQKVINDKKYKERMERLSIRLKDVPYDSLQHAAQWIEYVIRQNGTPFLRNSLCDEPWYRRYDWDVIGFLAIVGFIAFLISLWILLQILRCHLRMLSNSLR